MTALSVALCSWASGGARKFGLVLFEMQMFQEELLRSGRPYKVAIAEGTSRASSGFVALEREVLAPSSSVDEPGCDIWRPNPSGLDSFPL